MVAVLVAGGLVGTALASQVFAQAADDRLRIASQVGFVAFLGIAALLVVVFLGRLVRGPPSTPVGSRRPAQLGMIRAVSSDAASVTATR